MTKMTKPAAHAVEASRKSWLLQQWCPDANIAVSTYFTIPEWLKPRRVKIGKRLIILEAPGDWLERMRKAGGVPSRTKHAKTVATEPA